MGRNMMGSASEMVDLIKTIVRDEEGKTDKIITATVLARNGDDAYDVYIDSEVGPSGQRTVMKGVPNESKRVYRPGDHVYVMKVRGQVAQGFVIGSIGNVGPSMNARVEALESGLSGLRADVGPAVSLVAPDMKAEAFRYKATPSVPDADATFGIRLSWPGCVIPTDEFRVHTNLTIAGDGVYANGAITLCTYQTTATVRPTPGNRIRMGGTTGVFAGSTPGTVTIVEADVRPSNARQWVEVAFTNNGSPIKYDDVTVNANGLLPNVTRGFSLMDAGYEFEV